MNPPQSLPRPAHVCGGLLSALEASEGLRRKRKRDQTPDAIGLAVKRRLLSHVVQEDPDPREFEEWLLRYVYDNDSPLSSGAMLAMARAALDEWRMAQSLSGFAGWLREGAPSEDTDAAGSGV